MPEESQTSDQETSAPPPAEVNQQPGEPVAATSRPSVSAGAGPSQAAPLLMGVKLPIRILLGRTQLSLRDITQLGNGAVVELDCSPDDPVEIMVNDRVIAHGEVVVVSGNYGVRITKIASRHEDTETDRAASDLFSLSQKLR
jgi:flagellar motor switch protein FliN/FliY